jgi:hypothetical protein
MRCLPSNLLCLLPVFLSLLGSCNSPANSSKTKADPRLRAEPITDEEWQAARPVRPQGEAVEARYLDYRNGRHLTLVNESHTDAGELYSERRKLDQSLTKVGRNEILDALEERLREQNFFKHAQGGPAPTQGGGRYTTALEFRRADRVYHLVSSGGGSEAERKSYIACVNDFIQLYTSILQLQSVEGAPGWENQSYAKPVKPGSSKLGIAPRQP